MDSALTANFVDKNTEIPLILAKEAARMKQR